MDTYKNEGQSSEHGDIAIIGMSMRFPQANNTEEFWDNLVQGKDCIRKLPEERLEFLKEYFDYQARDWKSAVKGEAGFLENIDSFDHEFFHITKREATLMDPNQRVLLEVAYEAMEDALYPVGMLREKRVGVYVGYIGDGQYIQIIEELQPEALSVALAGNVSSITSARISYTLDLKGPNMVINTSCSSSLVALHIACKALQNKECDMAMVGGVQIYPLPLRKTKIGIESSDYRAKTFDNSSDGTGCGEGAGVIVLKPLEQAYADKDLIYAVIKGSAVNQDGKSMGITSPNPEAQADVIVQAWRDAGIDPQHVSYIEAHGTGTKLGDPVEISGITKAFAKYTNQKQFCAVGAVKSNIGHLDSAAGIAGVIKAVLQLHHREIVPTVHFQTPNELIPFYDSPVFVADSRMNWEPRGGYRLCGISSFGVSGTNCHVVLQEPPSIIHPVFNADHAINAGILTLSAKTEDSLRELISKYLQLLAAPYPLDYKDICYSANIGREHYSFRLAVVASSLKEMSEKLTEAYRNNLQEVDTEGVFISTSVHLGESMEHLTADQIKDRSSLNLIAQAYVMGEKIDFEQLYSKDMCKKVRLPLYPFSATKSWVKIPETPRESVNKPEQATATSTNEAAKTQGRSLDHTALSLKDIEEKVTEIFTAVVEMEVCNRDDDFLVMGGDSILALDIIDAVSEEYGVRIPLGEFMRNTSVGKLTVLIASYLGNSSNINVNLRTIPPAEEKEYYLPSSSQRRMILASLMDETSVHYNISSAYRIKGEIEVKRLENAFSELVKRHEILRTSYQLIDGEIMQCINKDAVLNFSYTEGFVEQLDDYVHGCIKPFDFADKSLFRVYLRRLSEQLYILVCDMHHSISDGTSSNILLREFSLLYQGEQLQPMVCQYKDFSEWHNNQFLIGEAMKSQEAYWLQQYAKELNTREIPTDYPRPDYKSFAGATQYYEIDAQRYENLQEIALHKGVTLYILLLSAYHILLHRYSGSNDIVVGVAVSARTRSELENTVGMFVNTLAIRNEIKSEDSFDLLLERINETTLNAYSNQEYPFELLLDKLQPKTDSSRNPLFDTMFIMQSSRMHPIEIKDIEINCLNRVIPDSKFDLLLNCYESGGTLKAELNYCTALFKAETMEHFWLDYVAVLDWIIGVPEQNISEVSMHERLLMPEVLNVEVSFDF